MHVCCFEKEQPEELRSADPHITVYLEWTDFQTMQVKIHDDRARVPTKAGPQEVGYDLVCIKKSKTCLDASCTTQASASNHQKGTTQKSARSSIVKHNTMLANGIGIIDPTQRHTKICLTNPVSPFSLCQPILKPMPPDIQVTKVTNLDATYRHGGFGSTAEEL